MTKTTLEQLMSRTFKTHGAACKALTTAGYPAPAGITHEVAKSGGSWKVVARPTEPAETPVPVRTAAATKRANGRRSKAADAPATEPTPEPEPAPEPTPAPSTSGLFDDDDLAPAPRAYVTAVVKALGKLDEPPGLDDADQADIDRGAAAKTKPADVAQAIKARRLAAAPGLPDDPATPDDPAPTPTERIDAAATVAADDRTLDLSVPPAEGRPYAIVLTGDHVRQSGVVAHALDVSRKIRLPVTLRDKDGQDVRCIDAAAFKAGRRAERRARSAEQRSANPRPKHGPLTPPITGVFAKWCELALRAEGILRPECNRLNGGKPRNWKRIIERVGTRYGYSFVVDRKGEIPRYRLVAGPKKT